MASESKHRTGLFALGIELDGADHHPAAWRSRVQAAENAGFTFATIRDSIGPGPGERLDATVRAGFVAATTSTLGLVPQSAPTYAEPFHLSSQLASLDYASRGRAGWLAVDDPATARTWGATPRETDAEIRRERVDAIEVARRLWDSWEDDAVVRDYAAGKFLNRDRLHHIDFIGETFSVQGPAIVPRPPQGQVVVFGYGAAGTEGLDVALVSGATLTETRSAIDNARAEGVSRVLVDLEVTLDTPAELTALLTELSAYADCVRLRPAVLDEDLPVLARYVLPALLRAGLAHRPVPGSTLRSNLGLPRPANRYAKELAR
ncbi:LLM class flavin-dependent oxidoreductase [Nocardia seriolae]|uniref:Alkanesulfonate monooxygenase n=1 Tax=Nocardia seriolae TaxID=37332 RepID=A0ABC8AP89_9NOCA|nr:LLM class flavin-dependent oxidoreductase [Nocardia seriolae]APA95787.1 Alkanesulfonate monooxygenase [Nocardia seriolae]MTJ66097.1 LLM class flavin-dependent oxidoreductase [Nocardia seriolae]MTJ74111.1 LLM class flavin-dependent oxidoreductase [Nocardia seriolae]MTJ85986.1 LLM class flavin-dependent oxidoreductase [Nocardia seriolae]MTK29980.1 LLM class flavin-dependent oxidoreductase [Nocardia seriolae]